MQTLTHMRGIDTYEHVPNHTAQKSLDMCIENLTASPKYIGSLSKKEKKEKNVDFGNNISW